MQGSLELCHIKKWSDLIIFLPSHYHEASDDIQNQMNKLEVYIESC